MIPKIQIEYENTHDYYCYIVINENVYYLHSIKQNKYYIWKEYSPIFYSSMVELKISISDFSLFGKSIIISYSYTDTKF